MVFSSLINIEIYREKITLLHCEISANYIDCSVSNWCTANTKPNPNNNPNPNTNTKPLLYLHPNPINRNPNRDKCCSDQACTEQLCTL